MIPHPDPKLSLGREISKPLSLSPAYIVGVNFDGTQLKAYLKLYEPITQRIFRWDDKTGHRSYMILKDNDPMSVYNSEIRARSTGVEQIEKFDALIDQKIPCKKVYARDPTTIGGRRDSLREFVKAWECDIRYTDCYIQDTKFEPGMPYLLQMGYLVPTIPEVKELPQQLKVALNETVTESMMKRFFRLFEASVPEYRRCAVDIEVNSRSEIRNADPAEAESEIIACSLSSSDKLNKVLLLKRNQLQSEEIIALDKLKDKFEYEFFETEEELISAIFRVLWEYPFILTWNGDQYDFRYLYQRSLRLGFQPWMIPIDYHQRWMGLKYGVHIDLMRLFENRSLQTYAFGGKYKQVGLDEVATAMIGEGKMKHEEAINAMNYVVLASYGWKDADLTYRLTTYGTNTVMKLMTMLSRISYQSMEDVSREGASGWIKNLIFREHRVRNVIIPRSERSNEPGMEGKVIAGDILDVKNILSTHADIQGKKFKGAVVLDPVGGVHFNVSVLDFASLYPSIIETWNLSYETVRCCHKECETQDPRIVPFTTHWICRKNRGMTAEIIGTIKVIRVEWYKHRAKEKGLSEELSAFYKTIDQTLKVFMNATYGVFSSDHFPLYCPPMGESVTSVGRFSTGGVVEEAKRIGVIVFYGDTDSIFMTVNEEELEYLKKFAKERFDMMMDLDQSYVWLALSARKKNYLGLTPKGDIVVKGLTGKKRHTPQFIKDLFQKLLNILKQMKKNEDLPTIKDAIIVLVRDAITKLETGKYSMKELAFTVGMTRDPDDYVKTVPMHVRVARTLEGATGGSVISFVKTTGPEKAKYYSLATQDEINIRVYEESLEKMFVQVLDCLGIRWFEVVGQRTIDGKPMPRMPEKKKKPKKK